MIAESYERIHRSNLVGMGIIPLQYLPGENAESLGLTGKESYSIDIPNDLKTGQTLQVKVNHPRSQTFMVFVGITVSNVYISFHSWIATRALKSKSALIQMWS